MKTKLVIIAVLFFAVMTALATLDLAAPDTARPMGNRNMTAK